VSPQDDEQPADDADRPIDFFEPDDDEDEPPNVGSLVGAIGQIAAAVLVVVLLVVLFIGGAVGYRWIFG
jgi:hypothetical protein